MTKDQVSRSLYEANVTVGKSLRDFAFCWKPDPDGLPPHAVAKQQDDYLNAREVAAGRVWLEVFSSAPHSLRLDSLHKKLKEANESLAGKPVQCAWRGFRNAESVLLDLASWAKRATDSPSEATLSGDAAVLANRLDNAFKICMGWED